jgi:hypothetical protein
VDDIVARGEADDDSDDDSDDGYPLPPRRR